MITKTNFCLKFFEWFAAFAIIIKNCYILSYLFINKIRICHYIESIIRKANFNNNIRCKQGSKNCLVNIVQKK